MSQSSAPSSARTTGAVVTAPLLRDPPSPPGYVDPLEGHVLLEDLVEASPQRKRSPVGSSTGTT